MASLRERNGKWTATVEHQGKREACTFPTREAAEAWGEIAKDNLRRSFGIEPTEFDADEIRRLFYKSKQRAAERGIEYLLSLDDIKNMLAKSGGKCAISGIYFNRDAPAGATKRPWYPSVDRVDSSGPYTIENCRLVCVAVNIAMGEWGEWALRAICEAMFYARSVPPVTEQGAGFSFPALDGEATYRQKVRRRMREMRKKSRQNSATAKSITENQPLA